MPLYAYKCPECKTVYEFTRSMSDTSQPECYDCKVPLIRDWNIAGVAFKGGGWGSSGS